MWGLLPAQAAAVATGHVMQELELEARKLNVTCKTGDKEDKKHFLGLSDNVTFFAEQMEGANVSPYHYRVVFKPQTIIPDIRAQGDAKELIKAVTPQPK